MDAARKSYEIQAQVRHNAEEFKNTMNDLYNWQKEIKNQEIQLQAQAKQELKNEDEDMQGNPVRSQTVQKSERNDYERTITAPSNVQNAAKHNRDQLDDSSTTEKCDTSLDAVERKRKEANEIKDKGNTHTKLGAYQLAIEEYTRAIDLYNQEAIFFCNRALCFLKLERYEECINDCNRAIDLDSMAVKAYYRRMLANESLGNNMDALKDCTTVLTIEPKNAEAKRSLERINERLRKNVKSINSPSFNSLGPNMMDILPIEKPVYKRSNKPLKRIPITDIVGPKEGKDYENLKISDEDIDKLFNSNCGPFEEIKNNTVTKINYNSSLITEVATKIKEETKYTNNNNNNDEINEATQIPKTAKKDINSNQVEQTKVKTSLATTTNKKQLNTNKLKADLKKNDLPYNKEERPIPATPTSTAQFYCNWKDLTKPQKYQYLKSIPLTQLNKILGAGFDSDTLSDVIYTLYDYYVPNKVDTLASTLLEISKHKQISILSLLMSNEENKILTKIIDYLKETSLDKTIMEQIINNFNLN